MCHSPSSVCFSVLILHLKFTGRHGERWMDREREGGREQERDGGVCRCPLKGKEHLDSLSRKKKKKKDESCQPLRLALSLLPFQSFSAYLILVYTFISRQFITSFSPADGFSFLSHTHIQASELEMSDHPLSLTLMQKVGERNLKKRLHLMTLWRPCQADTNEALMRHCAEPRVVKSTLALRSSVVTPGRKLVFE